MTSDELNSKISKLEHSDKKDFGPKELAGSGKMLPYYGWFWRSVDFDRQISLAYANGDGFDVPGWVGFCENNKWGYEEFAATVEQSAEIKRLCEAYVEKPSEESCKAIYDYMQSIRPAHVTGEKRWDD